MKADRNMAAQLKEIRARLEAAARPEVLASMRRAVPNTKMLGVSVPTIRALAAEFAKEHPLSFESTLAWLDALCRGGWREEILVGIFLLARHKKHLAGIAWSAIDGWLDHIDNWETCDQLASNVVAAAAAVNPELRPPLRRLTRASNLWRRRFAVATAASLNQRGRLFPEFTLEICQDLMCDETPAIRKAVGWALRELSKKDPDIVFDFLVEHGAAIPRTVVREGSQKLSAGRRAQLLPAKS